MSRSPYDLEFKEAVKFPIVVVSQHDEDKICGLTFAQVFYKVLRNELGVTGRLLHDLEEPRGPFLGEVWFIEGDKGKPNKIAARYDTSG